MMEMVEDNQEKLGSKLYVDLANFLGELSKIERRGKRMRKRIGEYDGSDASVLVPSDVADNEIGEEDYEDGSESSGEPVPSESDFGSEACSNLSSNNGSISEEIKDDSLKAKASKRTASGYYMRYMGKYYSIPKNALLRNYQRPVKVLNHEEFVRRCKRCGRTRAWRWEPICPAAIIVVKAHTRCNKLVNLWCVAMEKENEITKEGNVELKQIIVPLPMIVVDRLYRALDADTALNGSGGSPRSSLLDQYKPLLRFPIDGSNALVSTVVLPGPSRLGGTADIMMTGAAWHLAESAEPKRHKGYEGICYVAGNWWPLTTLTADKVGA
jgi:hypothetical protein